MFDTLLVDQLMFFVFCCACDLKGERRIWRIQMSNPQCCQIPVVAGHFGKWLIFANFTCFCWPPQLDSYWVLWILHSVIFLSLWCFHIFYRHQRFPQMPMPFFVDVEEEVSTHSSYYPAISSNMVGIFDLRQLRRSHSKWIQWRSQCRSRVVRHWVVLVADMLKCLFLKFFFWRKK